MTILHHLGTFIRDLLATVPLSVVRALFLAFLVLLLIWVLRLPRDQVVPPGGKGRWDENLKLGASLALAIQILVYSLL